MALPPDVIQYYTELCKPEKVMAQPGAQPLEDYKILDLSYANLGGSYIATLLAEFGAECVKVEPPSGDPARYFSPYGMLHNGMGLGFIDANRNKFFITLNLETEKGREIFKEMVKKVDVVIETFKPGYMDSLGIGYRQLKEINPGLVYVAVNNYGQYGPLARTNRSGYDIDAQAMSGLAYHTGELPGTPGVPEEAQVPTRMGSWVAWMSCGHWGALGVLAALWWRRKTGKGQMIDVSPWETAYYGTDTAQTVYQFEGFKDEAIRERAGPVEPLAQVYAYFPAKDGWLFIGAFAEASFQSFCDMVGRADLKEKYPMLKPYRVFENAFKVYDDVKEITKEKTIDEWVKMSLEWSKTHPSVVMAPVRRAIEVYNDEGYYETRTLVRFKDPIHGDVVVSKGCPKYCGPYQIIKWLARPLGADNEFIYLKYLGYTRDELEKLKAEGVI